MGLLTAIPKFLWRLFTSKDAEQTRQAEIDAFGGGMKPKEPKK